MAGKSVAWLAAAALVAVTASFAAAEEAKAGAVDAAKLWTKNCQSCHGPDGKGKTKMGEKAKVRDLSAPDVKAKLEKSKVIDAITNGVKEEGSDKFAMKPYADKLSKEEIEALADHSMSFK